MEGQGVMADLDAENRRKQEYLKQNVLDQGYDAEEFSNYMKDQKGKD